MNDPLDDPISDYLSGLMDERETAEFERRMASDPALRLEVEAGRETLKRLAGYLEQTCPGLERADAIEAAAVLSAARQKQDTTGTRHLEKNGMAAEDAVSPLVAGQVVSIAPMRRRRLGRILAQGVAAAAIFAAGILVGTHVSTDEKSVPAVGLEHPLSPPETAPPENGTTEDVPVAPTPSGAPSVAPPPPPDGERVLPVAEPVRVAANPVEERVYSAAYQTPPLRVTRREGARMIVESAPSRALPPARWVVDGSLQMVPSGTEKTEETEETPPEVREKE